MLFGCLGHLEDFVASEQWVGPEFDVCKLMLYGGVESLKCEWWFVFILEYCVIISSEIWHNTTIFYSINSNNYIMDTKKLLGEIGKKFRKK